MNAATRRAFGTIWASTVAVAALVALGASPPAAEAAALGTNEAKRDTYVRSFANSWAIGTLFKDGPNTSPSNGPERMFVQKISSGGWAYGMVYGNVQRCGWVKSADLKLKDRNSSWKPCSESHPHDYHPSDEYLFSFYGPPRVANSYLEAVVQSCSPSKGRAYNAYANYRGGFSGDRDGTFRNRLGEVAPGTRVLWRYMSNEAEGGDTSRSAIAVKFPNANQRPWGSEGRAQFFMPASCVGHRDQRPWCDDGQPSWPPPSGNPSYCTRD